MQTSDENVFKGGILWVMLVALTSLIVIGEEEIEVEEEVAKVRLYSR